MESQKTISELEAGLDRIRQSPSGEGYVELIVGRPSVDSREVLVEATLDPVHGLIGDSWSRRAAPNPDKQLTLMNARAVEVVAGSRDRWPLAGDQLFVDFDLGEANIPAGTQLQIGSAIVEITPPPHRGCQKFTARFGPAATAFVNSPAGIELNLRGVNARVLRAGSVRPGDCVRKLLPSEPIA